MLLEDAHALAIRIAVYRHVPAVRPTRDAEDLAAALCDPACGGYPRASVRTLIDDAATRDAILAALDDLARVTTERSTVVIYFSGHGARFIEPAGTSYYLVPVDASGTSHDEIARTAISSAELSARLRAIPAGRIAVVLDCCRAAEMADLSGELAACLAHGHGRAILAASRADGGAYAKPDRAHSTFTACLIRGLRGAAPGAGGVIRVCDLFHYAQQQVALAEPAQHPVLKAELEENFPIALLRGGAPEPLVVPSAPDDLPYDVFVSYRHDEPEDRSWVTELLVPYLESVGIRVCLPHRDFRLGASRIEETERAVAASRYTMAVLTPAYVASAFEGVQWLLAAHAAAETGVARVIPLLRRRCELTLYARMTAMINASDDAAVPAALQSLAIALRTPPRVRSSA
jgi:hypothetical protein